jgi:hypothetical protein
MVGPHGRRGRSLPRCGGFGFASRRANSGHAPGPVPSAKSLITPNGLMMVAPLASAAGGDGLRSVRGRAPRSRRVRRKARPGRRTDPSARCRRPASGPGGQGMRTGSSRLGDRGHGSGNAAAADRDGQRSHAHRAGRGAPAGGCPRNHELDGDPPVAAGSRCELRPRQDERSSSDPYERGRERAALGSLVDPSPRNSDAAPVLGLPPAGSVWAFPGPFVTGLPGPPGGAPAKPGQDLAGAQRALVTGAVGAHACPGSGRGVVQG